MTLIADASVLHAADRIGTEPGAAGSVDAGWSRICPVTALHPERGVAAMLDGQQVAVFLLHDGTVRAVQQTDPFASANVMSRGLVGTWRGRPSVASPMYKHVFDLESGACLDAKGDEPRSLRAYRTRVVDGVVEAAA